MSYRATSTFCSLLLALALTLSSAACGDGDPSPASSETNEHGAPSTPGNRTETVPDSPGTVDACLLVTAEEIGDVLGQAAVVSTTEPGACTYAVGPTLTVRIDAYEDPDGTGLEGAFSELEAGVSGRVEPVVIGESEGLIFNGTTFDVPATTGGVLLEGLIITINFVGGDPATNVEAVTQLLEFAIDGD